MVTSTTPSSSSGEESYSSRRPAAPPRGLYSKPFPNTLHNVLWSGELGDGDRTYSPRRAQHKPKERRFRRRHRSHPIRAAKPRHSPLPDPRPRPELTPRSDPASRSDPKDLLVAKQLATQFLSVQFINQKAAQANKAPEDYYQNLSTEEKKQLEIEFKKFLDKPETKAEIEQQIALLSDSDKTELLKIVESAQKGQEQQKFSEALQKYATIINDKRRTTPPPSPGRESPGSGALAPSQPILPLGRATAPIPQCYPQEEKRLKAPQIIGNRSILIYNPKTKKQEVFDILIQFYDDNGNPIPMPYSEFTEAQILQAQKVMQAAIHYFKKFHQNLVAKLELDQFRIIDGRIIYNSNNDSVAFLKDYEIELINRTTNKLEKVKISKIYEEMSNLTTSIYTTAAAINPVFVPPISFKIGYGNHEDLQSKRRKDPIINVVDVDETNHTDLSEARSLISTIGSVFPVALGWIPGAIRDFSGKATDALRGFRGLFPTRRPPIVEAVPTEEASAEEDSSSNEEIESDSVSSDSFQDANSELPSRRRSGPRRSEVVRADQEE